MTEPSTDKDRTLLICVFYESPWEKLCNFCWGIRNGQGDDDSFRWVIGQHPKGWKWILYKIANWAEQRDIAWRRKYAVRNINPPKRWKRVRLCSSPTGTCG